MLGNPPESYLDMLRLLGLASVGRVIGILEVHQSPDTQLCKFSKSWCLSISIVLVFGGRFTQSPLTPAFSSEVVDGYHVMLPPSDNLI